MPDDQAKRRHAKPQINIHLVRGEPIVLDGKWTIHKVIAQQFAEGANVVLGVNEIQDTFDTRPPGPQDRIRS